MQFAQQLTANFATIAEILQSVAVLLGVIMTLSALFQLKKYGEQRTMMSSQHSIAGPLMMLVCGAMLLILPNFIGAILLSMFGSDTPGSYTGDTSGVGALINPILVLIRVVGIGAFIRGIVLLSRVGSQQTQQGTAGKALIHIVAGALCIHIMGTISLLENMLGLSNN